MTQHSGKSGIEHDGRCGHRSPSTARPLEGMYITLSSLPVLAIPLAMVLKGGLNQYGATVTTEIVKVHYRSDR